jgi:signal transduction histidine kinase
VSTEYLLNRLATHRTLGSLPQPQITWIATHGVLRHLDSGAVLTSKDGPVDGLHVVLAGHLAIHVDRGTGRRKIMEWRGGDVTGLMPYSRLVSPPGDVVAEEPTELITVYRDCIPEMIRECYELTAALVHVMVDRARHFTASYLHDEKLVSLGKLAAGLAHELNNPASAIARSARALSSSFLEADAAARFLGSAGLTTEQVAAAERVREACLAEGIRPVLSPLEQEDREDAIAAWLKNHNADTRLAEVLAETDVTFDMLNQLASLMSGTAFDAGLRWIAAGCAARHLTLEIQEASSRIYDLVGAVKGFTQMDRETVPEPIDAARGLADTLVVLRAKAKAKSVGLSTNIEKDLPAINGFGGELNQVWANLIDNALDAVSEGGRVELTASCKVNSVVVQVTDDGPGVPAEIRDRIFDPFFTTKPIGKGTGLGLDIVRRLVLRHNGEIELDSKPGKTQFRVILPVAQSSTGGIR